MNNYARQYYELGYNSGYQAAIRGQKFGTAKARGRRKRNANIVGYGLSVGQMEVIKMQVQRFNVDYLDIARQYGVSVNAIRQIVETKQFADIKPLGTESWGVKHPPQEKG